MKTRNQLFNEFINGGQINMNYSEISLKMHEENKGKISVASKVAVANKDDLSTAYTPGVAEPCRKINKDKNLVYKYTSKGNLVAVKRRYGCAWTWRHRTRGGNA